VSKPFNVVDKEIVKERYLHYIVEGNGVVAAAKLCGVHPQTIERWKKQDRYFNKAVENARSNTAKEAIEKGLAKLAAGADETTIKDEWVEDRLVDGETRQHRVSKVVKTTKPDLGAIRMLATKYAKGEYEGDAGELTIRITQKDRTLTIEERRKLLSAEANNDDLADIEAECTKLVESLGLPMAEDVESSS